MALDDNDLFTVERVGLGIFKTAAQDLKDYIGSALASTYCITNSGRFKCDKNKWTTNSDDQFGENFYNFQEDCKKNAEPLYEWEHLGQVIPKGHKLRTLLFAAIASNNKAVDLDIRIVVRYPDPITRWETGINADNQQTIVELYNGLFSTVTMTGSMETLRKRNLDLGNYEMLEDGFLSIYLKSTGNGNSKVYASWTFEILGKLL